MQTPVQYQNWYKERGKLLRAKAHKKHYKTPKAKFNVYRFSAMKKKLAFELSLESFLLITSKSCTYCSGTEHIGVDRRDNSKGYTTENSFPCCSTCNYMKKTLTHEMFLAHIRKIVQHNLFIKK